MGIGGQRPRSRLGRYEILAKLARGGMAELFLARVVGPEGFEKLFALKRILPEYADNQQFVKAFLDEAKLVAALDHPHIAHVHDMGQAEGQYFFAMEYVHGRDVRSTLQRTVHRKLQFPIGPAIQIARDVASALHYAHERKAPDGQKLHLVHRDVSPSNILISYEGVVKLVDFGIAKLATGTQQTRAGLIKGKISYMSPEQARGEPLDRRSDVFSLGIVLWEMITTQQLVQAENELAGIQFVINMRPPPPSQLRSDCPRRLDQIVLKALAPDLAKRYQSADAMFGELEDLAHETKVGSSTVGLRAHMQKMFDAEITAWREAQEAGVTLTDHVIAREIAFDDDDEVAEPAVPPSHTNQDMRVGSVDVPQPLDADSTFRSSGGDNTPTTLATKDSLAEIGLHLSEPTSPGRRPQDRIEDRPTPTTLDPIESSSPSYDDGATVRQVTPRPERVPAEPPPAPAPVAATPRAIASTPLRPLSAAPAPVVTSYPSLHADPAYSAIQRDRVPDRVPEPKTLPPLATQPPSPKSARRAIIIGVVAALASAALGVGAALAVRHFDPGSNKHANSPPTPPPPPPAIDAVATPADTATIDDPAIGDAVAANDWVHATELCAARAPNEVPARDRAGCAIAACSTGKQALAVTYYNATPPADQPNIEHMCHGTSVELPPRP